MDNENLKLSKLLGCTPEQLEILDIVDVVMAKNIDVPRFLDLQTMINFTGEVGLAKKFFKEMEKIISRPLLSEEAKILLLTKENEFTRELGLGYSNGGYGSGPDNKVVKKMIELVSKLADEDEKYLDIPLFRFALKGMGADGLSDLFANTNKSDLIIQNNELIAKLKSAIEDPKTVYENKNGIEFKKEIFDDLWYIEFQGSKRYLTNINYTISNGQIIDEVKEYERVVDLAKDELTMKIIDNRDLIDFFERAAKFNLMKGDIDINVWKDFVDGMHNNKDIMNIVKFHEDFRLGNPFDLARAILNTSSQKPKEEKVYQDLVFTALKVKSLNFTAEAPLVSDATSGNVDFIIEDFKTVIEMKVWEKVTDVKAPIIQITEYGKDPRYSNHKLCLMIIAKKGDIKKIKETYLEYQVNKDIEVIILKHNYRTASQVKGLKEYKDKPLTNEELAKIESKLKIESFIILKDREIDKKD